MLEDWSGLERYKNLLDDGHAQVKAPPPMGATIGIC